MAFAATRVSKIWFEEWGFFRTAGCHPERDMTRV